MDKIFLINNNKNCEGDNVSRPDQIKLLNELIKTNHKNNEEKKNIVNTCNM